MNWIDITEKERRMIDFSVNTNPLGLPESVVQKLPEIAATAEFYPDSDCKKLRSMLAQKYHMETGCILCGNGADDLLYRLVFSLKPAKALIVEPAFEEYGRALRLVGCQVVHYLLDSERQFDLDERILSALDVDLDMVFLCNPNNPTGRAAEPALLEQIAEICQKNHTILVVDECFMEFLPGWRNRTLKQKAARSQNLIVIDAFTKTYSLAGFRLGYGISGNQRLLSGMKNWGQAFGVSVPAQFAGICCLQEKGYSEKTYSFLADEREWLLQKLRAFPLEIIPSETNYLLFKSSGKNLREELLKKGIKVRDCSQFYGLGNRYCRIAVRSRSENEQLIAALKDLVTDSDR